MEPYIEARVHKNWRWNYNTGGGQLLDWIGHHGDIAKWRKAMSEQTTRERRPDLWGAYLANLQPKGH